MTLSENIGHFAGALVPVLVSLAAGPKMYALLTALSGLFVAIVAGLFLYYWPTIVTFLGKIFH